MITDDHLMVNKDPLQRLTVNRINRD